MGPAGSGVVTRCAAAAAAGVGVAASIARASARNVAGAESAGVTASASSALAHFLPIARVSVGSDFTVTSVPRPGFQLSDQIGWSSRSTPLPVFNDGYRHGTAGSGPGASAVFRSHRLG